MLFMHRKLFSEASAASCDDVTDFAYPSNDDCADVGEEMLGSVGKCMDNTLDQPDKPECETTIRKRLFIGTRFRLLSPS